jgi:hypothetical protein
MFVVVVVVLVGCFMMLTMSSYSSFQLYKANKVACKDRAAKKRATSAAMTWTEKVAREAETKQKAERKIPFE